MILNMTLNEKSGLVRCVALGGERGLALIAAQVEQRDAGPGRARTQRLGYVCHVVVGLQVTWVGGQPTSRRVAACTGAKRPSAAHLPRLERWEQSDLRVVKACRKKSDGTTLCMAGCKT